MVINVHKSRSLLEVMTHSIFAVVVGYPALKLISPVVDGVDRTEDKHP